MKILEERYNAICDDYIEAFKRKHHFYEETTGEYYPHYWIVDIGDTVEISNYFIPFHELKMDIDREVEKEVYFQYYNYILETEKKINYQSYLKGAR